MRFMCPNCQRENEVEFDVKDLQGDLSHIEEIDSPCSDCEHITTLHKPNRDIRQQLEMVQECYESGTMPEEFCTTIKMLIKQEYAYISGINKDGQPVLKATESGHALAEWWDNPITH